MAQPGFASEELGYVDVVDGGDPSWLQTGPGRRWVGAGLVLVLLVAVGASWGDRRLRAHEYSSLVRCVTAGQSAVAYADAALSSMGQYVGPALGAASPSLRLSLLRLVSEASSRSEPEVSRARSACRDRSVFYPHRTLRSARAAYLSYLEAKSDWLRAVTVDGAIAYHAPKELVPLLAAARRSLEAAAPNAKARLAVDAALGAT